MLPFLKKLFAKTRIIHAVERHEITDEKEIQRRSKALASWDSLYKGGRVIPVHYSTYKRTAIEIGDSRRLPYLKDVLEKALTRCRKNDLVMFTNDDIILHPQLPEVLLRHLKLFDACSSQRVEFHYHPMPSLDCSPAAFASRAEWHMGRDLFGFTRQWLERNWDEIPDFILGASDWDLCLAAMIRYKKGYDTTKSGFLDVIPCCEIPLGYVIHEWHEARWSAKDNVNTSPSQVHNRRLFMEWSNKRMINFEFTKESTLK